ncbi:hypothetical protein Tco_0900388 [Tanacetum coccineum]
MVKIHTDKNVADLLTKAFDLYLIPLGKAKKSVKLMMEKLFRMKLELMLSTSVVKTINGEVQLHALVDDKKIIISEAYVRRDLKLEDKEGINCLPNSTIFEQLALMGYDKISQKLTFYKPFFSPQWKFLIHTILQCLSPKTTAWNAFSSTMASAIICLATNQKFNFSKFIFEGMIRNLDNVSGKFLRKPKRKDTQVSQPSDPSDNVTDEAVHKELGNSLVRAATTASSLEAEQDNGNITKTRSKATPNESSSLGTTSGGGPRCQETMGDTIAQTRFENVSKLSNDSLLARGNTLRSDEDRLKLNELMELCTTLQKKVLDLEKTKTTQANEIASLKRRVKKLEKKRSSRTHKLKRLYKVGLSARVESSRDEEDLEVNDEVNVVEEVVEAINTAKLIIDVFQVSDASVQVSVASAATTVSAAMIR